MGDSVWLISRQGHLWPWQNTAVSTVTLQFHTEWWIGIIDSLPSSLWQLTASCCLRLHHCTQAVQMRESFFVEKKKTQEGKEEEGEGWSKMGSAFKVALRVWGEKGSVIEGRGEVLGGRERLQHAECVWGSYCRHLWPWLGFITMTKASKPCSYLASLVEGGQEVGGVCEAQWELLLEVNRPVDWCNDRQRRVYNHMNRLFTDKADKVEKEDQSLLFFTHSGHSLLFILPAWALKTNIWPSSRADMKISIRSINNQADEGFKIKTGVNYWKSRHVMEHN